MSEEENKKRNLEIFARYGILTGILLAMFGFLVLFSVLSQKSWQSKLRIQVQQVLDESKNGDYLTGDFVFIRSNFNSICAVYKLESKTLKNDSLFALIFRTQTLYGPVPAVYIYNETKKQSEFVDFAGVSEGISDQIKEHAMVSQIQYWKKRIPSVILKMEVEK